VTKTLGDILKQEFKKFIKWWQISWVKCAAAQMEVTPLSEL